MDGHPRAGPARHPGGARLIWAAFAGCAFGFLYSETGASVLRSVGMGVAIGASTFGVLFYRYYTHEDAEGRRIR